MLLTEQRGLDGLFGDANNSARRKHLGAREPRAALRLRFGNQQRLSVELIHLILSIRFVHCVPLPPSRYFLFAPLALSNARASCTRTYAPPHSSGPLGSGF